MKKTIIYLLLLSSSVAYSQSDYRGLIESILADNPTLSAQKARMDSEVETMKAANMLSGPELEAGLLFPQVKEESKRWDVGISQSFDWPGTYAARRRSASHKEGAFRMLYRSDYVDKALEVKLLLTDYAKAVADVELLKMASDNLNSLTTVYKDAYEKGNVTIIDYKKLLLEIFSIDTQKAQAEFTAEGIRQNISGLAVNPVEMPLYWSFPGEKLRGETEYIEEIELKDPTGKANCLLISSAEEDTKLSKLMSLPGFSLGYRHAFEDGKHFNGFSVGVSFASWSRKHSELAALNAEQAQKLEAIDYSIKTKAKIRSDYALATRLESRIKKASSLFAKDDYVLLLKKSLEGGAITLYDFLNEVNNYIQMKKDYIELLYNYETVVSKLNRYDLLPND